MSISKSKIKFIRSLNDKKNRDESGMFIAEGEKIVRELIQSNYIIDSLIATDAWLQLHESIMNRVHEKISASQDDLSKTSNLSTPNNVIAIVRKNNIAIDYNIIQSQLTLVLDGIQDPGNLGTILRIADWFGINDVICSENTVDTFNPKVIQSSMGAFIRVRSHHVSLDNFFEQAIVPEFDVYGASLDGNNVYSETLKSTGLIVMGNESKGINAKLNKYINRKLMIPGYPAGQQGAESLNVSVATGIICGEFRRRS